MGDRCSITVAVMRSSSGRGTPPRVILSEPPAVILSEPPAVILSEPPAVILSEPPAVILSEAKDRFPSRQFNRLGTKAILRPPRFARGPQDDSRGFAPFPRSPSPAPRC